LLGVLCCFNKFVDHGGHQGNVARAIARWRDIVASHEATNAFHWAMHIAPYCPGGMAIEIVTNLPAFFVSSMSLLATTIS
jgi:hypothetical protein